MTSEIIVHDADFSGRLVEIVFCGGGREEGHGLRQTIKECVELHNPEALLLDVQRLRCPYGDHVSGFIDAVIDRGSKSLRPACFLIGKPGKFRSMRAFFELLSLPGGFEFFEDRPAAVAYLQERLDEKR